MTYSYEIERKRSNTTCVDSIDSILGTTYSTMILTMSPEGYARRIEHGPFSSEADAVNALVDDERSERSNPRRSLLYSELRRSGEPEGLRTHYKGIRGERGSVLETVAR